MKSAIRAHSMLTLTLFLAGSLASAQTAQSPQPSCGSPGQGQRLFNNNVPDPQDIGKNLVIGRLKAIEGTQVTIARPDGTDQLVIVDASTEFFRDYACSATLANFKIGEQVFAIGTIEDGDFLADKLIEPPAGPNPAVRMPCNCSSDITAQAASASDLALNNVGTRYYFWQMWTKAYDVGHELPLKVPNTESGTGNEKEGVVIPPVIFP